jgi:hypothetical protein
MFGDGMMLNKEQKYKCATRPAMTEMLQLGSKKN